MIVGLTESDNHIQQQPIYHVASKSLVLQCGVVALLLSLT
jgi:hypothetical protein